MNVKSWENFWRTQKKSFDALMLISSSFFAGRIQHYFQLKSGQTIFDYGCGPGFLSDHFMPMGIAVTGADISEDYIAQCRNKHPGSQFILIGTDPHNNETIIDNALGHELFDYVVLLSIVQYFKSAGDVETIIGILKKKLKPSGKILLADIIVESTSSAQDAMALLKHCLRIRKTAAFARFIFYLFSSSYFKLSRVSPLLVLPESFFSSTALKYNMTVEQVDGLTIHPTRKNYIFQIR